ncbi:unnamed protein product [Linum tenue]|uniref:Uncharacterized protein n=1 Tax=Linum tenue TaxID=586396 RepID=A0AAV0P4A7_9ROSI|nr:unnamed protein product [Linum tenue]
MEDPKNASRKAYTRTGESKENRGRTKKDRAFLMSVGELASTSIDHRT